MKNEFQDIKVYGDLECTGIIKGAFNAPQGFLLNGKIVPSVASNNLTVAIKTLSGADPSLTDPVYVRIGDTVRTIISALSVTKNAATNWFNAGSTELATFEIDYFVYIGYNATIGVTIGFARIPFGRQYGDFSATTTNEKYCAISNIASAVSTDFYENVGRFSATLSAGAGYTWSIPTYTASNLIQRPIYETRWLDWQPSVTASGSMTIASLSFAEAKYKISGDSLIINYYATYTTGGTASSDVNSTVPFTFLSSSILGFSSPCYDSADFQASGIYQGNGITIRKNGADWTLGTGRVFGIHTFGRI